VVYLEEAKHNVFISHRCSRLLEPKWSQEGACIGVGRE
jgi:hypothetical protein